MKVLLVIPPLTQPNTAYPSTPVLAGFLKSNGVECYQADIGIELLAHLFSPKGLSEVFDAFDPDRKWKAWQMQMYAARQAYCRTIEPVMRFLSGKDLSLAYVLVSDNYLPRSERFQNRDERMASFGDAAIHDKAKFLASLYLEDLGEFIRTTLSPHFELARYGERIAMFLPEFGPMEEALRKENSLDKKVNALLDARIQETNPGIVGFSIPFPGNLYSALQMARYIKSEYPEIKVVLGGGFINTELRAMSDSRIFSMVDFICLDDGELPLYQIVRYSKNEIDDENLCRTFYLKNGKLKYAKGNESIVSTLKESSPCFEGLTELPYFSAGSSVNPMHRLWTDGRWNKMVLAHGCYWAKCAFCDTSLPYIASFKSKTVPEIVNQMEAIMQQTGQSGFHFVDEAAPPRVLKELAIELLKRGLQTTWWTNIRYEKYFTADVCRLLAASGCIAVTGGLETASDRLLVLMNKGVNVEQAALVANNFTNAGIMVHAYLMYGFPSQTMQETLDSLEIVRQFFKEGILYSAFWHRFALTVHSPVYMQPGKFGITIAKPNSNTFANNEAPFTDPVKTPHNELGTGLVKALYNFMHQNGLDWPLQRWFDIQVPATAIPSGMVHNFLKKQRKSLPNQPTLLFIGDFPVFQYMQKEKKWKVGFAARNGESIALLCNNEQRERLDFLCKQTALPHGPVSLLQLSTDSKITGDEWMAFLKSEAGIFLRKSGLLVFK